MHAITLIDSLVQEKVIDVEIKLLHFSCGGKEWGEYSEETWYGYVEFKGEKLEEEGRVKQKVKLKLCERLHEKVVAAGLVKDLKISESGSYKFSTKKKRKSRGLIARNTKKFQEKYEDILTQECKNCSYRDYSHNLECKMCKSPFPAKSGTRVCFLDVERSGGGYDTDPIQVNTVEMKLMMFI